MVDAHCHLNDEKFTGGEEEVFRRAREAGVTTMICAGGNLKDSQKAIELAHNYEGVWATVGMHPEETGEKWSKGVFEKLAEDEKVVAIGETGLDFRADTNEEEKERQIRLMEEQVKLANMTGLPLVVHNRNADEEIKAVLEKLQTTAQMHCFNSGEVLMKWAISKGFFISVGGIVTFKNAEELRRLAAMIPEERLLIETDAPYLAPEPVRGSINEPKNVRLVAERMARIRQTSIDQIEEITGKNAKKMFGRL